MFLNVLICMVTLIVMLTNTKTPSYTQKKIDSLVRVIGLHQKQPAHASKLISFRISYRHMLVGLPVYAGKLTRNLVKLLAYARQF